MKYLVASMVAVLAYSSCAQAQDAAAAKANRDIYFASLTSLAIAERCEAVIPGYKSEFDPAFEKWKVHNAAVIEAEREAQRGKSKPDETLEQFEAGMREAMLTGMDYGLTAETLRNLCGRTLERVEKLDVTREAGA